MKLRSTLLVAVLAPVLVVGGCVSSEPIKLSSAFAPSGGTRWAATAAKAAGPCHVSLVSVRDARPDTGTMGSLGYRMVLSTDAAAWVRSGFETLKQDTRVRLVEPGGAQPALGLTVELVKAYTSSVNTEIASNVVVKVSYTSAGAPAGEMVFRGADNIMNWASGDDEAKGSLDRALREVIVAVDKDVLARCAAPPAAPAAAS